MFKKYKANRDASQLLAALQMDEGNEHFLWVIDYIMNSPLPYGYTWESDGGMVLYVSPEGTKTAIHPAFRFYSELYRAVKLASQRYELFSLPYRLTADPPSVIKDVFHVLYYFSVGIEEACGKAWLAMAYLSTPLSSDYAYDDKSGLFMSVTGAVNLEGSVVLPGGSNGANSAALASPIRPHDDLFYGLARSEITNAGCQVLPRLDRGTRQQLSHSTLVAYNFRTLSTELLQEADIPTVERVVIPYFAFEYESNMNLFAGLRRAGRVVFDGAAAEPLKNLEYITIDDQPLQLPHALLNADSRLQPLPEQLMESDLSCAEQFKRTQRCRNALQRRLAQINGSLEAQSKALSLGAELRAQKLSYEGLVIAQRGEVPLVLQAQRQKLEKYVKISFREEDKVIQELIARPPDKSVFSGRLQLTEELVQQVLGSKEPLENEIADYFRRFAAQRSKQVEFLDFKVVITYIEEYVQAPASENPGSVGGMTGTDSIQISESRSLTFSQLEQMPSFSHSQQEGAARASEQAQQEHKINQKNLLTQSVVKYYVNNVEIPAVSFPEMLNYKPSILDYAIGSFIQYSGLVFVINYTDPTTHFWYEQQLRILRKMRNTLEIELIRAGQIKFTESFSKVEDDEIFSCTIRLRSLLNDVILMFNRLKVIKNDIELRHFV